MDEKILTLANLNEGWKSIFFLVLFDVSQQNMTFWRNRCEIHREACRHMSTNLNNFFGLVKESYFVEKRREKNAVYIFLLWLRFTKSKPKLRYSSLFSHSQEMLNLSRFNISTILNLLLSGSFKSFVIFESELVHRSFLTFVRNW